MCEAGVDAVPASARRTRQRLGKNLVGPLQTWSVELGWAFVARITPVCRRGFDRFAPLLSPMCAAGRTGQQPFRSIGCGPHAAACPQPARMSRHPQSIGCSHQMTGAVGGWAVFSTHPPRPRKGGSAGAPRSIPAGSADPAMKIDGIFGGTCGFHIWLSYWFCWFVRRNVAAASSTTQSCETSPSWRDRNSL